MATLEERVSRLEGGYEHLATKSDIEATKANIAELRGEMQNLRLIIAVIGIGLAGLNVALKFLG